MEFKLLLSPGLLPENQFSEAVNVAWPEMGCFDSEGIEAYFHHLTKNIQVDESINGWRLLFLVYIGSLVNANEIQVYKRGFTYPADNEKEISIYISLPTANEISWGIADKRRFNNTPGRKTDAGFIILPVDYSRFDTMAAYIEDSIKRGLKQVLTEGITLKGKKIKIDL